MVDRYWRKIESVENNIKNSMQISSILLKLKGYDKKLDDLSKIENNENNISSNLGKIDTNKNNISNNLGKIDTNKNNTSSNFKNINNIENNMNIKIRKDIYKKTFVIPNMSTNYNSKNIADIYSISNLTKDGIIKIDASYNYSYDKTNNLSHVYKFYNKGKKFKEVRLNHNIMSNIVNDKFDIQGINSTKINILIYLVNNNKNNNPIELFAYNTVQVIYNDNIDTLKSDINISNISSNLGMINTNKNDISSNLGMINTNKNDISSNLGMIDTNKNNISSNLGIINTNKSNISSNLSKINDNENSISNNLEKIDNFTQYILKSSKDFKQTYIIEKQIFRFNKDKHFYKIFEKEIEYDFIKNSLLFVKNNIYYKYDNLANDYYRLQHEYNIYDSENNLIHKYLFNKDTC